MADGLAPAIDKVGQPAPGAPEAEAAAPTVPTIDKPVEAQPEPKSEPEQKKVGDLEGAGPKVGLPRPVEVMSVPETPVNGNTPAGGTPRPVLNTVEEPTSAPAQDEPTVMTGVEGPAATAAVSKPDSGVTIEPASDAPVAAVNVNGDAAAAGKPPVEMAGALQTEPETDQADEAAKADAEETLAGDKKRKLEDEPAAAPAAAAAATTTAAGETDKAANGSAESVNGASDGRSEKKIKTNAGEAAAPAPAAAPVPEAAPAAPPASSPNGKAAKKESKKPAPAVGKTARKTRSQGPVEV